MMHISKPSITDTEKGFVEDALKNADIGLGEYIAKFEEGWAAYNNKKYAVSCNSGTNALFLALKGLGIGPGDEVIVPEFTMIACAWAVSYTGAMPVFVDCQDDLNIDPDQIEKVITSKTKAIMPVHIYGRPCDMNKINQIAKKHNLFVVEDMAEAHGIVPKSDIACYSFYGNKILTTGEGGMCLTDNEQCAMEMRSYANMYFDTGRTMVHPKMGYNFRLTNLQAAIGYAQVLRAEELINSRKEIASWYDKHLPKRFLMPKREVVWVYDIDCGKDQALVKQALFDAGIESRFFFKPMSEQPMYKGDFESLNAYTWSRRGLYIPTYYGMTEDDVIRVAKVLEKISK